MSLVGKKSLSAKHVDEAGGAEVQGQPLPHSELEITQTLHTL